MAKKTVIGRACKLFVSTSDDAGVYGEESPEWQETEPNTQVANATEAVFVELPKAPEPEEVAVAAKEDVPEEAPADIVDDLPADPKWEAPDDVKLHPAETPLDESFFNL